jgi:hypothetical protein
MPRRTRTGGLQVNLTIDARAYDLLQRYAPTRKSYGRFLSTLIEEYDEFQKREELRQRIEKLEDQVARLAQS